MPSSLHITHTYEIHITTQYTFTLHILRYIFTTHYILSLLDYNASSVFRSCCESLAGFWSLSLLTGIVLQIADAAFPGLQVLGRHFASQTQAVKIFLSRAGEEISRVFWTALAWRTRQGCHHKLSLSNRIITREKVTSWVECWPCAGPILSKTDWHSYSSWPASLYQSRKSRDEWKSNLDSWIHV